MPFFNESVDSLVSFISSHENPYCTQEKQLLKNFVTQIYAGRTVANSLLNFLENVKKRFNEFYAKVYVDKVSLFHDEISRYNLPQLDDVNEEFPNNSLKSRKFMEKESQKPMKSLMIAKDNFLMTMDMSRAGGILRNYARHFLTVIATLIHWSMADT